MSFIKRLKNVMEAKANKVLDKHEDPIEMLELSIKKKEELLTNAKKQCANFIATVDKKNALEEKINKYEEATKAAILKEDTEKAQSSTQNINSVYALLYLFFSFTIVSSIFTTSKTKLLTIYIIKGR